ncbi:MAG: type II toxin-antitoxin system RelE family toxin [Thermoplasmatota archaeon]
MQLAFAAAAKKELFRLPPEVRRALVPFFDALAAEPFAPPKGLRARRLAGVPWSFVLEAGGVALVVDAAQEGQVLVTHVAPRRSLYAV